MDKPIPVLGIPIVNGVHWLKRLLDSVDYPVEKCIIINNNGKEELDDELAAVTSGFHPFIKKFYVVTLPGNIGCSGAWNLIIKSAVMADFWIISNHDICFGSGFLQEMVSIYEKTDAEIIFGEMGAVSGGFDIFLLSDVIVNICGLFDENFYPAYAEDTDYSIRLIKANAKMDYVKNAKYYHGDKGYAESGSQTWREDDSLRVPLLKANYINQHEYLREKWGPNLKVWQDGFPNPAEAYNTAFNKDDNRFYSTYDLQFVRRKYLGF